MSEEEKTEEKESVLVGKKRECEETNVVDEDKLRKRKDELIEYLKTNPSTDESSLKSAQFEGLKGRYNGAVICMMNEDGNPEALIKQSDVSPAERELIGLILNRKETEFSIFAQVCFYDSICQGMKNEFKTEDDVVSINNIPWQFKELVDRFKKDEPNKVFPLSEDEFVDMEFDVIKGGKNWVRTFDQEQINKFMTKDGYLCLHMTGWC